MPYKLRKAPKRDAYWVVNKETGTKHSKDPLPKERAEAQMRALYAAEMRGGMNNGQEPPRPPNQLPAGDDRLPPPNGDGIPEPRLFAPIDFGAAGPPPPRPVLQRQNAMVLQPRPQAPAGLAPLQIPAGGMPIPFALAPRPQGPRGPVAFQPPPQAQLQPLPLPPMMFFGPQANLPNNLRRTISGENFEIPRSEGESEEDEEDERRRRANQTPSPRRGRGMCGGAEKLSLPILTSFARGAYSGHTPKTIAGYKLVKGTPTLKFYEKGDTIIVAVRGTQEKLDFDAWLPSVKGTLKDTPRYKEDERILTEFKKQNPDKDYIAVGHSLAGAIIDIFLRKGLVRSGYSFNPMVEPQERNGGTRHRRIYNQQDPLFMLYGRSTKGAESYVFTDPLWKRWLKYKIPMPASILFNVLDAHNIDTMRGGAEVFDPTTYFKLTEPETKRVPKFKKVTRTIVNPEYDERKKPSIPPPEGRKGVKKNITITEEIPDGFTTERTGRMLGDRGTTDKVQAIYKALADLTHFYRERDPAASLGFRILKDDFFESLPKYTGREIVVDDEDVKGHETEKKNLARAILGITNAKTGVPLPRPRDRVVREIDPLLNMDFRSIVGIKPKEGKYGYSIPPRNRVEAINLLKDYPEIQPPTTMPYWFYGSP